MRSARLAVTFFRTAGDVAQAFRLAVATWEFWWLHGYISEGRRYLVAPRGETQWVRNLRVAGTGELRVGKHSESFRGRELTDDEKVPVLRAYLKRWKAEVGIFFEGTGPDASDDQIRAIAPKHPAFEVLPAG